MKKNISSVREIKNDLSILITLNLNKNESSNVLESEKKSKNLLDEINTLLQEYDFDGIELNFEFSTETNGLKDSYTSFVKVRN